jgi:hypothetical protein
LRFIDFVISPLALRDYLPRRFWPSAPERN